MSEIDEIAEIGIHQSGHLFVRPATKSFPYIYREVMGVCWDAETCSLFSPVPRARSYLDWYRQIAKAAAEQSCDLRVTRDTIWSNVPDDLRAAINGESAGSRAVQDTT